MVVTGLGSSTYDVAACGDHPLNFYLWGAMGSTAMVGLGLALARPDRRVAVITGDGDMLMGMGSLATSGSSSRTISRSSSSTTGTIAPPACSRATPPRVSICRDRASVPICANRIGLGVDSAAGCGHCSIADKARSSSMRASRPTTSRAYSEPRRPQHQAAVHAGVGEVGLGGHPPPPPLLPPPLQPHSGFAPENLTTWAHFSVSSAISCRIGWRARERHAAQIGKPRLHLGIGQASVDLLVELLNDLGGRNLWRAYAVPRARLVARHESPTVGMSGSAGERIAVVTASARSLPALMYSIDEGMVAKKTCTCPPSRSVSAGPPPRYGTCTMSAPAIILNSSPATCGVLPLPADAMLILSGLALV